MEQALFAGTFDPPTLGHISIIQRAACLFGKLMIGVAKDSRKDPSLLSIEDRVILLKDLTQLDVIEIKGLLADFVKKENINVLLRAIRTTEDVYHELSMAEANKKLCGVETVFLMADPEFAFISGSLVRDIARNHGDLSAFLPTQVIQRLK